MPVITTMYSNFDGDLPLITRILIAMTNFFKRFWWLVAAAVCLAIAGVRIYGKSEQGRIRFSNWAMRLPVLGRINIMKGASQFANTLSTLLTAGLPMTNAIQTASRVIDNYALGLSVASAVPGLEEGKQLGDLLKANPYLPPLLTEMTGVGEESGSLEDTLDTIGAYYDNEVETSTAKLLSMLEPVITVIMGIVIGFIIIGLYIPMFGMYGGIG